MNSNWTRCLISSINNHLYSSRGTIQMHFDEQHIPPQNTCYEVRLLGPTYKQHTKTHYTVTVDINILIKCLLSTNDSLYLETLIGHVLSMLSLAISVYEYPNQTLLGCLQRKKDLVVTRYGQINPKVNVTYASVETSYAMELIG